MENYVIYPFNLIEKFQIQLSGFNCSWILSFWEYAWNLVYFLLKFWKIFGNLVFLHIFSPLKFENIKKKLYKNRTSFCATQGCSSIFKKFLFTFFNLKKSRIRKITMNKFQCIYNLRILQIIRTQAIVSLCFYSPASYRWA